MPLHQIEVWVLVDEDGEYVMAKEAAELAEQYKVEINGGAELARRVVKLAVAVAVEPFVTLVGEAPAEGKASLTVE